jgi:hypothetical protein
VDAPDGIFDVARTPLLKVTVTANVGFPRDCLCSPDRKVVSSDVFEQLLCFEEKNRIRKLSDPSWSLRKEPCGVII